MPNRLEFPNDDNVINVDFSKSDSKALHDAEHGEDATLYVDGSLYSGGNISHLAELIDPDSAEKANSAMAQSLLSLGKDQG